MALEYWFACYFGRAMLVLRRSEEQAWDEKSSACRLAARGGSLPAGKLLAVQEFAARTWAMIMLVSGAGFAVAALVGAALPNGIWRDAAGYLIVIFAAAAIVALTERAMIGYRANQTRRYVLRGGPRAALAMSQPPRGQPRSSDFWVILVITLAGFALIFYGLSNHSA